ncbi:MAG: hypothetical protein LBR79_02630 [Oscillospiraceae bacterium]|nr:hypothetical protein [Oscillospiraceae bacterium]
MKRFLLYIIETNIIMVAIYFKFVNKKIGHVSKYSCYDLKQSSKVNLFVYFLPADGREKIIKIRCFSNETVIVEFSFFPAGGRVTQIN